MKEFSLKIVTPDGIHFDGMAQSLSVRTTTGDMGILADHVNCVAPLGMGMATVVTQSGKRYAACIGGMVSVVGGKVILVPTTFEWSEEIDLERAKISKERAQTVLAGQDATDMQILLAQARLKRALVRTGVAGYHGK